MTIFRPAQPPIIEVVRVAGNRRISTEAIQAKIETEAGEPFSQVIIIEMKFTCAFLAILTMCVSL